MKMAHLANLGRSMTIARPDAPEVVSGHAIQPVYSFRGLSGRDKEPIKRVPVVSPFAIKAKPPAKCFLADLPSPPRFENVLIARQHGLNPKHDWPLLRQCFYCIAGKALARRKGMIVADQ